MNEALFGSSYPPDFRSLTRTAPQGREAVAEFQKILDHRGVVGNQPIEALAHLGLARAYVLQGDTVKARAAYQDFLALSKGADPDLPILKSTQSRVCEAANRKLTGIVW